MRVCHRKYYNLYNLSDIRAYEKLIMTNLGAYGTLQSSDLGLVKMLHILCLCRSLNMVKNGVFWKGFFFLTYFSFSVKRIMKLKKYSYIIKMNYFNKRFLIYRLKV